MARTFYHNISKRQFNVTDRGDLIDDYTDGDFLMKSEAGCAIVECVSNEELQELITAWKENNSSDEE